MIGYVRYVRYDWYVGYKERAVARHLLWFLPKEVISVRRFPGPDVSDVPVVPHVPDLPVRNIAAASGVQVWSAAALDPAPGVYGRIRLRAEEAKRVGP